LSPSISYKRHIAKTITWRVIASFTTFVLALIFFKDDPDAGEKAVGVAIIESGVKMLFYYGHERLWYKINNVVRVISNRRHIAKAITWRVIASVTTFLITLYIFKEESNATEKATGLMLAEALIKMGIYYAHERVWYKINFGVEHERKDNK
jgi:uncharacterized membrane protein